MQNTKINNKFNTFSLKNSGVAFSMYAIVFVLLSFIVSIAGTMFLTIVLQNPDKALQAMSTDLCSVILTAIVQICFFVTAFVVAKVGKVNFFSATKLNVKPNLKDMLVCIAFSFGIVFALLPVSNIFMAILEAIGYKQVGGISANTVGEYIAYIFLVCALPAFVEEIMFRGVILQGLRNKGDIFSIFISAFLFSIFHQNPSQTIHQFLVGVIWATLVIKTGSIWVSMLLHFLNNFIAITFDFILNMTGATEISNVVNFVLLGVGIVVFALGIVYFVLKYFRKKKQVETQSIEVTEEQTESEKDEQLENVVEEQQSSKSVFGKDYEVINGLSRERIGVGKFFAFASIGLAISGVMWILNLLMGMGVIAL